VIGARRIAADDSILREQMPDVSLRPCANGRCPELVRRGYCAAHARTSNVALDRRAFDITRGTSSQRGYDADWRRMRLVVLREEPVCRICRRALSGEADHIIPIAAGGGRLDRKNLQGLCKPCHSRKTATEDSKFAARTGGPGAKG
jgi:5-methylcytosine-specific restriction protein A